MNRLRILCLLAATQVFLASFVLVMPVEAQPVEGDDESPVLGVALSGGGAKGFAHIGVLKVLEQVGLPVDVVTGTSMGSVVGGLYAMGYTAEMLEAIASAQDWDGMFSSAVPRRLQPVEQRVREERFLLSLPLREGRPGLPAGLIPGQRIAMSLARITLPAHETRDFTKLPVPFACVATDIETGDGVRLDQGSLADAIHASIAIPTVFSPVKIGERTYIDGGVARNLPAEDARALGADLVLCVDVSSPLEKADSLNSLVDIMQQAVGYRIKESTVRQRQLCDVLIRPDVMDYEVFDFDKLDEIIAQGEDAARALMPRLNALADSVGRVRYPRLTSPPLEDSVFVSYVLIEELDAGLERQVEAALGFEGPRWFTASELEAAIERVYSRQVFEHVTYRIEGAEQNGGTTLVVRADERIQQRLGIGIRYDSRYQAAVLLDATARALGRKTLAVHFRLGEVLQLGGALGWPVRAPSQMRLRFQVQATRAPIDVFEDDVRTSSVRTEVLEANARAGIAVSNAMVISLSAGGELFNLNRSVGVTSFLDEARGVLTGTARLYLDTFDQSAFPHRGHRLTLTSGLGGSFDDKPFSHHHLDWQARWPLTNRVALIGRLIVAQAYGDALPLHYRFYAGGSFDHHYGTFSERHFALQGFEVHQLGGRSVQAAGFGAQYRVGRDVFLMARWNAAYVSNEDRWSLDPDAYRHGLGLTVGVETLVGPLEITFMSRSVDGPYDLQVNVGHTF